MKRSRLFRTGLIATLLLGSVGCSSKDDKNVTDGGAGARSSSEYDDILAEIEALKKKLADSDGDRAALEQALADAQARLAELESPACGEGGDCTGISDTLEGLLPLSDAYCDWVFGCCSADEARSASFVGASAEECKANLSDMILRGYSNFNLYSNWDVPDTRIHQIEGLLRYSAPNIAEFLQKGTLTINASAINSCATWVRGLSCYGGDREVAPSCDYNPIDECEDLFVGQQVPGGDCSSPSECEDGYTCGTYSYGYGLGVIKTNPSICIPEPKPDSPCVSNDNCFTDKQTLYCDTSVGKCTERPVEGEHCEYSDPNAYYSLSLSIPCQLGLSCSMDTNTCVTACADGALCERGYGDDQCNSGFCNVTDVQNRNSDLNEYYGFCDEGGKGGEERNNYDECVSYGLSEGGKCQGIGGEACQNTDECATYSCVDNLCTNYCGHDPNACPSSQYCDGSECINKAELGEYCEDEDGCLQGFCDDTYTCQNKVSAGADCPGSDSSVCPATQFCMYTDSGTTGYQCAPRIAEDGDCSGDSWNECLDDLNCSDGTCVRVANKPLDADCSNAYECASKRCDYDTLKCVAGKNAGASCDASNPDNKVPSLNTFWGWDECAEGLYCAQNAPGTDDYTGKCTKQKSTGSLCTGNVSSAVQCEGNYSCSFNYNRGSYVCPYVGEPESCVLPIPYYEGGD